MMRALQQPTSDARGRVFLRTAQTTRHYLGYHQSNTMPVPALTITERDLRDQFLPAYEAFQLTNSSLAWDGREGGRAEGIMCSYASFDGTPSCASKRLLHDILRDEWGSEALVQSDCCNSISTIWSQHHFEHTEEDAVVAAFAAGTQICFACGQREIAALTKALHDNKVKVDLLDRAIERLFLTRMRLGEFDTVHPFAHPDTTVIDSPAHRAVAREIASASIVLLQNPRALLPLDARALSGRGPGGGSIAVVGPFADCGDCYLHSYNGRPSYIVSPLRAVREVAARAGVNVVTSSLSCSGAQNDGCSTEPVSAAVRAARSAEVTIAVLGIGSPGTAEHRLTGECEGWDRSTLALPPPQLELLRAVRNVSSAGRMIVVLITAGPVALDTSLTDALLYAGCVPYLHSLPL
eukprot:COSAG01_NODE_5296_length_4352_cov_4.733365_3_plen_408_part_00